MRTLGATSTRELEALRDRVERVGGAVPGVGEGAEGAARDAAGLFASLPGGCVHEWMLAWNEGERSKGWEAPLAVMLEAVSARVFGEGGSGGGSGGMVVWVGTKVWANPAAWREASLLARSVFVSARTRDERVWAMDVSVRCAGVSCVVGDGEGLSMSETRRLHLASAESARRGAVLLARPWWEARVLSAARTRWRVTPWGVDAGAGEARPAEGLTRAWRLELLRCKGRHAVDEEARVAGLSVEHETGAVRVAGPVPGGRGAAVDAPGDGSRARVA